MSDKTREQCPHERILTWHVEGTGEQVPLWSCAKCSVRFEPLSAASSQREALLREMGEALERYVSKFGNCGPVHDAARAALKRFKESQ